jgi:16S rRNA (cytosine1402-N4)-methyltransferase
MDEAERGFSIKSDGPLDMRMDRSGTIKASDIINGYPRLELVEIFKRYGDERFAFRIADRIVKERQKRRIENTSTLAEMIKDVLPYRYRFRRIHPATKVFMALRIVVNKEIESLQTGLAKITPFLNRGSRLCAISFHSIEDRIVKNKFKEFAKAGDLAILTKKPIQPGIEEVRSNLRSRSAKLRVAEKLA